MTILPPDNPAQPRASVVIPNWNGLRYLRPCLESLRAQTLTDFEVIVVDNASSDDSLGVLEREFPEVRRLPLKVNGGYTGGCNAGIRAARAETVVLLNNDTEAEPGWLEALVSAMGTHHEAGITTSRIMLYSKRDTLNAAGDCYNKNGLPDSRGVWQLYQAPYDQPAYVFSGSGGAMALRRSMLDEIGLFDESFFMWCEDVDLGWRCQLAGWKCLYVPDAVIYHHLSASGGGTLASYYVGRTTLWVLARNMPPAIYQKHRRAIWEAQARILVQALHGWRGKASRARLRGVLAGIRSFGRWKQHNKALMQCRKVDDDYIESILS